MMLLTAAAELHFSAYFVVPNPSAQENSRNSSFGADIFL
jgi:hypothetical protein